MTTPTITRPVGHDDSVFVVSVSGGKDSTATVLAMREAGIEARYVFSDTVWEAPQTYEHLAELEHRLGITIDRVGHPGGMVDKIRRDGRFPTRMQRWCTKELKVFPLRAYHDALAEREDTETVSVLGIRADESPSRAAMAMFEHDDRWGGYVWRPLLHWTVADVLAIYHRHGVPVNPLYKLGFNRVGCMPCVFSAKEDVRLMAEHFPERIDLIRELEAHATEVRKAKNAAAPGRYKEESATFFLARDGSGEVTPIDKVVAWSRTARGGVQLHLIQPAPDSGCFRWGMCEPPTEAANDVADDTDARAPGAGGAR